MSNLPLEKAYYTARASDTPITFGESDNHNTQIAVEFEILDESFSGETITWVGHFTDKTAARSIESLQIAGWQGDDLSELAGVPGSQVLGAEVSLTCEPEEYDGKWTLRVKWVNRPSGGGRFKFKKEISGNDLKAFGAQFKATVRSVRASGGVPRKPKNESSGGYGSRGGGRVNAPGDRSDIPPPSDNDIPY